MSGCSLLSPADAAFKTATSRTDCTSIAVAALTCALEFVSEEGTRSAPTQHQSGCIQISVNAPFWFLDGADHGIGYFGSFISTCLPQVMFGGFGR
jgi:hypothetical protein